MSAIDKEKIFIELRKYHENSFDEKLSTPKMTELRDQFEKLEDRVVNMLLSLVNGKFEFEDLSSELLAFKNTAKVKKTTEKIEEINRGFFISKINHLSEILEMAKSAPFKLKPARYLKTKVDPKVVTKITKK